jgi:sugar lactone lactonase YvrE
MEVRFHPLTLRAARCAVCALAIVLTLPATSARGAGAAWTSYLYPTHFPDLVATRTDVWATTREGGLVRYDRATGALERIVRTPGGLASNALSRIALDRSGRLWVGTVGNGVSRLRADRSGWDVVNRLDGLPSDSVTAVVAVGDTVWIGTTGGLALWNGNEVSGALPDPNNLSFDTTFVRPIVTGIVQIGDTLWVATRAGVGYARLSTGLTDWRKANQGLEPLLDIEDLAWDGKHLVTVGQSSVHGWDFGLSAWSFIGSAGLPLAATGTNGTLLLTNTSGVYLWDGIFPQPVPGSPVPFPKPFDEYPDYLRAVTAPDGAVFAGTGSYLYEQTAGGSWILHDVISPLDNALIGLSVDRDRVYAQSFLGFSRFDGTTWRRWPSAHPCAGAECDTTFQETSFGVSLFVDSQGGKWAGFWSSSLDRFEDDAYPFTFQHLTNGVAADSAAKRTWTYSGTEDASGHVWLGMDTPASDDPSNQPIGLTSYSLGGGYLGTWSTRNSEMRGLYVRALAFDRFGRVWLGYKGQGVDWFQPHAAGAPAPVDSSDFHPLPDPAANDLFVRGIVTYGDTLWVLSESDLRRYSLNPGATPATLQTTYSLPANQTDLAVRPLALQADGSLWIATSGGVVAIHPGAGGTGYTTEAFTTANSPLVADAVRSLAFDSRGRLWIATTDGLQVYDPGYQPQPPPPLPSLTIKIYPNPVYQTAVGVNLRLETTQGVSVQGKIFDISGRRVRSFQTVGSSQLFWNGRDEKGNLVKPGVYFVRATAGDQEAFARIVLIH